MNTQERIKIVKTNYPSPNQVLLILLIVLASFGMGLIPILYGLSSPKAQDIVAPSQASLWSVLGKAE
jgi:hypothetical protein